MAGPIGEAVRQPRSVQRGNGYLLSRSSKGEQVRTMLYITGFNTDLSMAISAAKLRRGVSHRPIRTQERFVNIDIVYSAFTNQYDRLVQRLQQHWAYNLNRRAARPMVVKYLAIDKTWRGFIEEIPVNRDRFDLTNKATLRMRTISYEPMLSVSRGRAPYMPTRADIEFWGAEWYQVPDLRRAGRRHLGDIEDRDYAARARKSPQPGPGSQQQQ